MSRKKRSVYLALCAVLLAVMAFSGWKVVTLLTEYRKGTQTYQKMEELSLLPPAPESEPESEAEQTPSRNFDALWAVNPDVVAWLSIPGTKIDYPVVQGPDDQYYLRRMITGEWNIAGSIFLDAQCSAGFSDPCSIVYGHNMRNGTMFSDLVEYKQQEFYDAHPAGLLETPEGPFEITFFSGFVANSGHGVWDLSRTKEDLPGWAAEMAGQSWFQSGLAPKETDRVLVLSTCSYEFDNARFVLLGALTPSEAG